MQFVLTGFTPDSAFRVFRFEGAEPGQAATGFTVAADLSLIRTYGILVQELPLLCRELLERSAEAGLPEHALTLSESDMRLRANRQATDKAEVDRRKALRRTPPRRPAPVVCSPGMAQSR
jgi:hypothetical protein